MGKLIIIFGINYKIREERLNDRLKLLETWRFYLINMRSRSARFVFI